MATPSSSSTTTTATATAPITTVKLKTLLQTFIFSHMYRIARALTKAKSFLIQIIKDMHLINNSLQLFPLKKNKQKKLFFGSFRLHYNWCSSPSSRGTHRYVYYDSSWNYIVPTTMSGFDGGAGGEMQLDQTSDESFELSKYLQWLEEKGNEDVSVIEIDKLADMFIANCHEKFLLEKQESYRRYQEMMARSV